MADFDEKLYEEDEFAEGPDNGSSGDNGSTQNEPPAGGGEPSNSNNTDDFTTEVLKIRGINDPSKIKFEDVTGAVIERSWDDLSKEEQLNIIVGDQNAEENEISDDEAALINAIRKSGGSVEDYLNYYAQENAPEPITEPQYKVNELSDDEVYALDLLEKVGSDNITDEELQQAIDTAKQNEDLYKKTVEGLRQEYIRLQQDKEAQQQNEIAARQQAQFQQFATSINSEISRMNYFMGQELELSPDEKEELSEFMLDLDEQGVSAFGRAMQDPEVFTHAAFWLLNQDKISEEITKQMQETYRRGYEQAKKDLGKSTSKFVFKPQNKTPDKYIDELSW